MSKLIAGVVIAPATNQRGTGSHTTPGTLTASPQKTASGYPATAVDGFPADTIAYAMSNFRLRPDLVVSGINFGQNLGPIASVADDIAVFLAGYATITELTAEGANVTTTTTWKPAS